MSDRKDEMSAVADELLSRGVWGDVAAGLSTSRPVDEIREYVALHDYLVQRKDKRIAKNPAGFLAACISKRLPFPEDFLAERRKTPLGLAETRPASTGNRTTPTTDDVDRYTEERVQLRELSGVEVETLEKEALASASTFVRETFRRVGESGGPLYQQMREKLLL